MEKIKYKEMKKIVKGFDDKTIQVKINGIIMQKFIIEKLKICFHKNKIILKDNDIEKIRIDIEWIANFYTNDKQDIIRFEFDQVGIAELHII